LSRHANECRRNQANGGRNGEEEDSHAYIVPPERVSPQGTRRQPRLCRAGRERRRRTPCRRLCVVR
jgi:hypothetical protein